MMIVAGTTLLAQAAGEVETGWLTGQLLEIARGGAEWVLWLLLILFVLVFAVLFERLYFLRSVRADTERIRQGLMRHLQLGDIDGAMKIVEEEPSMQARVVASGLRDAERGPEAVEELCGGAIGIEKLRYEQRLSFLATIGSNAPFIGLFGTVMGVILAFEQLSGGEGGSPGPEVMAVIAEALIATGVGLVVAIPAIVFYNVLKLRVNRSVSETRLLVQTMTAYLRSGAPGASGTSGGSQDPSGKADV